MASTVGRRLPPPVPALSLIDTGTKRGQLEFAKTLEGFLRQLVDGASGVPGGFSGFAPGQLNANSGASAGDITEGWMAANATFKILTGTPSKPTAKTALPGTGPALMRADAQILDGILSTLLASMDGRLIVANSANPLGFDVETSPDLTLALQAFLRMEEASGVRYDSWGDNHFRNGTAGPTQVAGKVGFAAHFAQASSQYLTAPNSASLQIGAGVPLFIPFWVKLDSFAQNNCAISKWNVLNTNALEYAIYAESFRTLFYVDDGTGTGFFVEAPPISLGVWHFVCAWWDPIGQTLNVQIDNGAITSAPFTSFIQSGTSPLTIGAVGAAGTGAFLDGAVDAMGVWKVIPSAALRAMLWNGGAGREIVPPPGTPTSARITVLPNNTVTGIATIALPTLAQCGGDIRYLVRVADATHSQAESGVISYGQVNTSGVYTGAITKEFSTPALGAGTLTVTFSIVTGSNLITIKVNANSSLTPTTLEILFYLDECSQQAVTYL